MEKHFLIILISVLACLFSKAEAQSDTTVYGWEDSLDVQAKFNDDYKKFLRKNLVYPEDAIRNRQQGEANLIFVIEKDSTVSNLQVEGYYPSMNAEALRLIELTNKKWVPGRKDGVPVRTRKSLQIIFRLN